MFSLSVFCFPFWFFIGCFWFWLEHRFNANDLFRSSLICWTNRVVLMMCDSLLDVLVSTNFIVACTMLPIANWVLRSEIDFLLSAASVAGCRLLKQQNFNNMTKLWLLFFGQIFQKLVINMFDREASTLHPGPETKKDPVCYPRLHIVSSHRISHSTELSFQFETFMIYLLSFWDNLEGTMSKLQHPVVFSSLQRAVSPSMIRVLVKGHSSCETMSSCCWTLGSTSVDSLSTLLSALTHRTTHLQQAPKTCWPFSS